MSSFSDISRMNLADLDRKGPEAEFNEEKEMDLEPVTEDIPEETTEVEVEDEEEESAEIKAALEAAIMEEEGIPMKMAEPIGTFYRVDAEVEESDLREFLFRHVYAQPITLIASVLCIVYLLYALFINHDGMMYGGLAVFAMDVGYPASLWFRAKATKKTGPYQNVFHYMFDEYGLHLELGKDAVDVEWKRIFKIKFHKNVVIIYTGQANAFIVPVRAMGAQKDEICAFIKDHSRQIVLG